VIGINSQIASNGGSNSGVGFAVPIDIVKQVVPELKNDGKIDRAYLGVSTSEAAPRDGALVQDVTGEPAQRAGLRPGDLIVSFDGRTIASPSDLGETVLTRKPGDTVEVVVQRNGNRETVKVTLGTRPDQQIQQP
jgi:S1-C subfamily serine protease